MATTPEPEPTLNLREQLARIDQIQANLGHKLAMTSKTEQDTRFGPYTLVITALGAGAALFAAGAAFTKLVIG